MPNEVSILSGDVKARDEERERISRQVAEFLSNGGIIDRRDADHRAKVHPDLAILRRMPKEER